MSAIDDFIHCTLELNDIILFQDQSSLLTHVKINHSSAISNFSLQVSDVLWLAGVHDVHGQNFANESLVVVPRLKLIDSERHILIRIVGALMMVILRLILLRLLLLLLMIGRILTILTLILFLVGLLSVVVEFLMEFPWLRVLLPFMNPKNIGYFSLLFFTILLSGDVEVTN